MRSSFSGADRNLRNRERRPIEDTTVVTLRSRKRVLVFQNCEFWKEQQTGRVANSHNTTQHQTNCHKSLWHRQFQISTTRWRCIAGLQNESNFMDKGSESNGSNIA
uniref:Uncharacterized protein n=1 Tax=Anopheles quadriannulatus TaxID=34691 RepID=A0A182XTF1_ANOQN